MKQWLKEALQTNPDLQIDFDASGLLPGSEAASPLEHNEQVDVFLWARQEDTRWPELELLFAIPNGGHRYAAVAAKLKAEGVKAGVPDVCLPVARGGFHGLFIEMKRADRSNHASPLQQRWIDALREQNFFVAVCYGAQPAINILADYLDGRLKRTGDE